MPAEKRKESGSFPQSAIKEAVMMVPSCTATATARKSDHVALAAKRRTRSGTPYNLLRHTFLHGDRDGTKK